MEYGEDDSDDDKQIDSENHEEKEEAPAALFLQTSHALLTYSSSLYVNEMCIYACMSLCKGTTKLGLTGPTSGKLEKVPEERDSDQESESGGEEDRRKGAVEITQGQQDLPIYRVKG